MLPIYMYKETKLQYDFSPQYPDFAKLNSNLNFNFNWVENSINFVFFSTHPPPTRNSSETPTSTSILISTTHKNAYLDYKVHLVKLVHLRCSSKMFIQDVYLRCASQNVHLRSSFKFFIIVVHLRCSSKIHLKCSSKIHLRCSSKMFI